MSVRKGYSFTSFVHGNKRDLPSDHIDEKMRREVFALAQEAGMVTTWKKCVSCVAAEHNDCQIAGCGCEYCIYHFKFHPQYRAWLLKADQERFHKRHLDRIDDLLDRYPS